LRYSLAAAEAEATRLAEEFVARRSDSDKFRHCRTYADPLSPAKVGSKHATAWVAVFAPILQCDEVIDGGELLVAVDFARGTVMLQGS
jgi:hypothetical protein